MIRYFFLVLISWTFAIPGGFAGSCDDCDGDGVPDMVQAPHKPSGENLVFHRPGLIGVSFGLQVAAVSRIDELTGGGNVIGLAEAMRLNSLAKDSSGALYSVAVERFSDRIGALVVIDPNTGAGSFLRSLSLDGAVVDVRGLAFSPENVLFAVQNDLSTDDTLYRIDPVRGVGSPVGFTGLESIQGLAFSPLGELFGWDIDIGLIRIDTDTGHAMDVNTSLDGTVDIQTIAFTPDGRLFGARDGLFLIDPFSGERQLIGSGSYSDVRGLEFIGQVPQPRAYGFWKHQCSDHGFRQYTERELMIRLASVESHSEAFPECVPAACELLHRTGRDNDMRSRAASRLLAVWLDLVTDRLFESSFVVLPDLTDARTVGEAIDEIETWICDPEATRSELETAKEIGEAIMQGDEDLELAAPSTALFVTPGEPAFMTLGLINMSSKWQSYDLQIESPWPATVSPDYVRQLERGGVALITVEVAVPSGDSRFPGGELVISARDRDGGLVRSTRVTLAVDESGGYPLPLPIRPDLQ